MPIRSRSRFTKPVTYVTATHGYHDVSQGGSPTSADVEFIGSWESESMDDVVTPDFERRRAAGEIIINDLNYVKESFNVVGLASLRWVRTVSGDIYTESGPGLNQLSKLNHNRGGNPAVLPDPPSEIMSKSVRLQALGFIDRAPYSFAEDIAELRETIRFLRDPFGSLRNLSERFFGSRRKALAIADRLSRTKALAEVWAQYQFAFLPLVRSIDDAIASYSDQIHLPSRRTARGFAEHEDQDSQVHVYAGNRWSGQKYIKVAHRAGILYEDANPMMDWQNKYGLRFKDIPETLWAIFPYSFMVDRVSNFSASLRGLTAFLDPTIKILGAWESVRTTTVDIESLMGYESPIVESISFSGSESDVSEKFTYTRNGWDPSFTDLIPPFDGKGLVDSVTKLADLAALIVLRLR